MTLTVTVTVIVTGAEQLALKQYIALRRWSLEEFISASK